MNRRKWLKRTGIIMLTLLALVVTLHVSANVYYGNDLRNTLTALQAAGEPLLATDLRRPALRPEDNAATLYEQIFIRLTMAQPATVYVHGKSSGAIPKDLQLPTMAAGHRYTDARTWTPEERRQILAVMAQPAISEALAFVPQALARPGCDFDLNLSEGPSLLMPHLTHLRTVVRLLATRAALAAEKGDTEAAAQDLLRALQVARQTGGDPVLISYLVTVACEGIAVDGLRYVSAQGPLTPDTAAVLQAELLQHDDDRALYRAIQGERVCFGGWMIEHWITRGETLEFSWLEGGGSPQPWLGAVLSVVARPWVKRELSMYEQFLLRYQELAKQPFSPGASKEVADPDKLRSHPLLRAFLPSIGMCYAAQARQVANLRVSWLGLALEQYKAAHGNYPADLAAVVPADHPQLGVDPCTSKPFVYRLTHGLVVLYSVGPNQRDNGGQNDTQKGNELDDITWQPPPLP